MAPTISCNYFIAVKICVLIRLVAVQFGRSKWNGNVGNSGLVLRVDTPLTNIGRPSFSVQINSGIEF